MLALFLAVTTIYLLTYLLYKNEDGEIKTYFLVTLIYIGSSTIALAFSYLSVIINGDKYVDLFGPCI